ncbi:FAD/NAD(P)-binding protein [Lonsdalea quercina]|uniref:FAD/NAD(P)-binding protein n=1 Tax=Lonsdalea quercina TaxID=71657 RepID=UPI003976FE6E
MARTTIAILGVGPRGLSILERLITLYGHSPHPEGMEILLVDPNEIGTGAHSPQQPDHLLVNTVASQITLFGDESVKNTGPIRRGLNFCEWARAQGYRNKNGTKIQENDYLPRRLLGEYLAWGYREITHGLPHDLVIRHRPYRATNMTLQDNGKTTIALEGGTSVTADFVFLTTGHGHNRLSIDDHVLLQFVAANRTQNPRLQYFSTPYPTTMLDEIPPQSRVLIQGMGLTAYDVLSQLTYGRGGIFTEEGDRLRYTPSGREPAIALFSRQALPFSSRGCNQKGVGGQYHPAFITLAVIDKLRQQTLSDTGSSKLDFEKQILPLLVKEMCYVYRSTLDNHWPDAATYQEDPADRQRILALFYPHQGKSFASLQAYTAFFMTHLIDDLHAAEQGNIKGAVKAATDVIRDVRDILRYAIDFGGLTGESHERLLEHYAPVFNRIAVGPPLVRNRELLALMEAGVVNVAGGPASTLMLNAHSGCFEINSTFADTNSRTEFDVLVKAKIDSFSALHDDSPFIHNLITQGIIRPFINQGYHPGGIDIDRNQHPISSKGEAQKSLWALGVLAEGPNFYTYVLPRPQVNSRALQDAGRCVIEMYQQLEQLYSMNDSNVFS